MSRGWACRSGRTRGRAQRRRTRLAVLAEMHHGVFSRQSTRELARLLGRRRFVTGSTGASGSRRARERVSDRGSTRCRGTGSCSQPAGPAASGLRHRTGRRLRCGVSLAELESVVELTCPRWRRGQHDGLVVHESKAFDIADIVLIGVIPTTRVPRTLLDLGALHGPMTVETSRLRTRFVGISPRSTRCVSHCAASGVKVGTERVCCATCWPGGRRRPERPRVRWRPALLGCSSVGVCLIQSGSTSSATTPASSPGLISPTRSGGSRSSTTASSTTQVRRRSCETTRDETTSSRPNGSHLLATYEDIRDGAERLSRRIRTIARRFGVSNWV